MLYFSKTHNSPIKVKAPRQWGKYSLLVFRLAALGVIFMVMGVAVGHLGGHWGVNWGGAAPSPPTTRVI